MMKKQKFLELYLHDIAPNAEPMFNNPNSAEYFYRGPLTDHPEVLAELRGPKKGPDSLCLNLSLPPAQAQFATFRLGSRYEDYAFPSEDPSEELMLSLRIDEVRIDSPSDLDKLMLKLSALKFVADRLRAYLDERAAVPAA